MSGVRSFIALPSPLTLQEQLTTLLSELKELEADVKWDTADKFHMTLKFLGNVEAQVLENLTTALLRLPHLRSFDMTYGTLGAFPDLNKPRLFWIGAIPNPAVLFLQKSVEEVCEQFGFQKEERKFHPHITLGRVKGSRNIHRLTDKLKSITLPPTTSRCTELLVMRSELRPSGSVYSVLTSIPLQS